MKGNFLMKFKALVFACLIVALFASFPVLAQEGECPATVSLYNGWARATAPGATVGAAYGLLVNLTEEDDTLVSATTDAAEVVELHEIIMEGEVMQMRPVEGGFVVPAKNFVALKQGGLHMMLINLTRQLEPNSTIDLTLRFENAGEVQVSIPVRDPDAMVMGDMGGDMMMESTPEAESPCGVYVLDVWARPNTGGAPNSGAYMLLVNPGETDDTLIGVASDVAQAVELHEMTMGAGDVMQMRPVEDGIVVPAMGAAQLQPGGYHVMLIGLTRDLAVGDTFDVTLTFEQAGEITVTVTVRDPDGT